MVLDVARLEQKYIKQLLRNSIKRGQARVTGIQAERQEKPHEREPLSSSSSSCVRAKERKRCAKISPVATIVPARYHADQRRAPGLGPKSNQNVAGRMLHHCKDAKNAPHKCMNRVRVKQHNNRALPRGRLTSREGRGPADRTRRIRDTTRAARGSCQEGIARWAGKTCGTQTDTPDRKI